MHLTVTVHLLAGAVSAAGMLTLEPLQDGERGAVVNTASVAGLVGAPKMSAYSASKHAVVALSEALRADLAARRRVAAGRVALVGVRRRSFWITLSYTWPDERLLSRESFPLVNRS